MSQIGYMMLAAGIGPAGYVFAIFHLLTHGFFKANMFLGAGSVMHGDERRRRHAALRRPAQGACRSRSSRSGAATWRSSGSPGFAGFWSKDKIIEAAFTDNWIVGVGAVLGAGITAFYMTRLMIMTFFGEKRWAKEAHPARVAAGHDRAARRCSRCCSALGGVLLLGGWIQDWLEPVVGAEGEVNLPIGAPG